MDPNLLYWKSEGQSFFSRLRIWLNVLDPSFLLSTDVEIQKARSTLENRDKLDGKAGDEWTLSLSSVHTDSGDVLPFPFRPPALFAISGPLVIGSLLAHSTVKSAMFWQFLLHSYTAGFNYTHRNSSSEQGKKTQMKQTLLVVGAVSYATVAGAIPQIANNRLGRMLLPFQNIIRFGLPIPLTAALAAFNVFTVRFEETENGVKVFDSNGEAVGVSKAAGEKAVRDTALARATLFGTTAVVPNLLLALLQRSKTFQKKTLLMAPLRHMTTALVLGLMIPVSFSLFPQLGMIKREKLEANLQAAAVDGHLFYHRGL